ncbi:MAG TPA: hypothetical protein VH142_13235 [Polyangiaceae bacterium]|nr:hypothetical protein [Polyangiaceae bacterium]
MLPPDFHSVLSACEHYGVELGPLADDVAAELAEHERERIREARQSRIAAGLPGFRRTVEAKIKALEPQHLTLSTLPSAPTDIFIYSRLSGGQLGAQFDPTTRTFVDVHVGFLGAEEWAALADATPHRTRDVVFFASGPFEDLRSLWSRAMNWRGISASANSSHSPGALESVLDRLVASAPDSLIACWWRSADDNLAQQIRAASQRSASRSDPQHHSRWVAPWTQIAEPEAAE